MSDGSPPRHRVDARFETTSAWVRAVPADRFSRLSADIFRAITVHAGSPERDDALLETVIGQAVETFLTRTGHPVAAAMQMEPLMRQIGAREAAIGRNFDVLHTSMRIARAASEAYFPRLMATHPLTAERAQDLREDLAIFLDQLRDHARAGFDRRWSLEEMSAGDAGRALRRMLFDAKAVLEPGRLRLLAQRGGVVLPNVVQPIVCLDAPLPPELLGSASVVAGLRPNEAMVFDGLTPAATDELVESLPPGAVLVVGVRAELVEVPRSLSMARRAATMIATGRLDRPTPVLRCEDNLGRIATAVDPYLLDALADRHLAALEAMSATRRLDLGHLLLEWLETGASINEIARRTNQHTQTLHSRMGTLRTALGDRLSDGDARVELILALRHVLPRWRRARGATKNR